MNSPDTEKTLAVTLPSRAAEATQILSPTVSAERRSVVSMLQPAAPGSAPAAAFDEKYQVIGELGRGGVGRVLKVMDRDLKREVAMKTLLPEPAGGSGTPSPDSLIRFIEEAQATGQLEHPNIVPVHDLGVDGEGRVYFTLKYVQGSSLKQVIRGRNEDNFTEDKTTRVRDVYTPMRMIEILISVCQAVAYAHAKSIIHRDLKPDNIMLGKYGEVLVMDWGLAKVLGGSKRGSDASATMRVSTSRVNDPSQATIEGSIAGTPAYMSPEQAQGRIGELDPRTDVYALGAILYEILTGMPPYRGADGMAIVKQVIERAPVPVRKKGSYGFTPVPRELAAICERAMARDPRQRYASAGAMRDDLQAYIENLPVSAAPDTRLQQLTKWVKRNKQQVRSGVLSAAAVLLVVTGTWFGWTAYRVNDLVGEGRALLTKARAEFQEKAKPLPIKPSEAYAGQMQRSAMAQHIAAFRAVIQQAMNPARQALELSPNSANARLLMAEANMDLWRLAIREENPELARVVREEVEGYAPDPSVFAAELNGFGSMTVTFDAPDAESWLFSFEPLASVNKAGERLPQRLIPVPYDVKTQRADAQFIAAEQARIAADQPIPPEKHSVFNLEPTPASKVGTNGKVSIPSLPAGRYLLLVRAAGRVETRVSLRMDRLGKVNQSFSLPKAADNPPGFFFMAGGSDIIVGGETAGAVALHAMKIDPAWIYHDEISMGEYGEFLKSLVQSGKGDEARQRLPKDFGKLLAALGPDGELRPADARTNPVMFAKSPVRGVSLNDAQAYIDWRGRREGFPYRLPKDWEWEAACRGADGRKYSWGDMPGKDLAVVTQGYGDTGANMSWKWEDFKDESPWGIHNLAGGAAEWTMSLFDPNAKPTDPVAGQRTIRGNAWALPPVGLECDFRTSGQPEYFHPTIGFRMALDHPYTRTGPASVPATDPHAAHKN